MEAVGDVQSDMKTARIVTILMGFIGIVVEDGDGVVELPPSVVLVAEAACPARGQVQKVTAPPTEISKDDARVTVDAGDAVGVACGDEVITGCILIDAGDVEPVIWMITGALIEERIEAVG